MSYEGMGLKWEFSDPDVASYGSCVVCGAPRRVVTCEIPNDKTGTYDFTRSLQCSVESSHSQAFAAFDPSYDPMSELGDDPEIGEP